ncbi:MAG: MFS transporter [Nocardioidaceae bacterium]
MPAPTGRRSRVAKPPPLGKSYWVVWWAATISFAGDGIYNGALPLLSASITRDPAAISWTTVMARCGWLTVGLLSGVLVDRWIKTRVMWRVDAIRAAVVTVFATLVVTGHASMPTIYAVALLLGLAGPFFDNAGSAVLPRLVQASNLERANSWNQTSSLICVTLVGPPLGAALFVWNHGVPLFLQAASFVIASALVASLARVAPPPVVTGPRSLRTELADGLRYLLRQRLLRTLALLLAAINAVTGIVLSLLVLYNLDVLGYPKAAYGWLISVYAVGGLLGTVLVPMLRTRLGTFAAVLLAASGFTVGTLLLGLFPRLPFVVIGIMVTAAGSALWNVVTQSLRQRIVPRAMLGRVTGIYRMVGLGAMPLGAATGGLIARATSVRDAYVVGGLVLVAAMAASAVPLRAGLADLDRLAAAEGHPDAVGLAETGSRFSER